ncbi:LysR family transcriptional regulator [Marinomonas sp. GJ51-6]
MKLDQLRAFIAVVETGSFRSAADAIHKTQCRHQCCC